MPSCAWEGYRNLSWWLFTGLSSAGQINPICVISVPMFLASKVSTHL